MGDIWLPGLGPKYSNWGQAHIELDKLMDNKRDAIVLAAIAGPESGYDMHVINDTPSTGDYSVGLWQINYYGSLYSERAREFGTPRQLAAGGLPKQARAAVAIFRAQGFDAWYNTYHSGDWQKYVGSGPVPPVGPGGPGRSVGPPPKPTADTWSPVIRRTSAAFQDLGNSASRYARHIRDMR